MEYKQYICPMHAKVVQSLPGKCPICGMNLVPLGKTDVADRDGNHGHSHAEVTQATGEMFYCPMHCEGDKKYSTPGKCPVCGMNLIQVGKRDLPEKAVHHLHPLPSLKRKKHADGLYYCPMLCEGDKKYAKPGDCPVCGMHLVKEQTIQKASVEYTCPMHTEIIRSEPGSCPICGMDLVPKAAQKDNEEEETAYRAMLKKFWVATVFTLPVLAIDMGEMRGGNPMEGHNHN